VTIDRLTQTVREQVSLGRLLPLGGAQDAAWITERAAVGMLRNGADALAGVRLGDVAVVLTALPDRWDEGGGRAAPAAPVGALPHVPVLIEAGFEATATEPLHRAADRLRAALLDTAEHRIGLAVDAVDLRVTGLLERDTEAPEPGTAGEPARDTREAQDAEAPQDAMDTTTEAAGTTDVGGTAGAVGAAARAVPGVARLTRRLAGPGSGVQVSDIPAADGTPGRRVQVQIALAQGGIAVEVARAVNRAATAAAEPDAPGPVAAAVVVTDAD
jgi:hypothetical protein